MQCSTLAIDSMALQVDQQRSGESVIWPWMISLSFLIKEVTSPSTKFKSRWLRFTMNKSMIFLLKIQALRNILSHLATLFSNDKYFFFCFLCMHYTLHSWFLNYQHIRDSELYEWKRLGPSWCHIASSEVNNGCHKFDEAWWHETIHWFHSNQQ